MKKIQPVRGFRDFYPETMAFRQWLFGKMREVSQKFGYQEYDGPILEPLELYTAKSSEELVNEQTFILDDRAGKKLAMRPELTPTLARMVAQKQQVLAKPLRWFSIGPRFRYEKPQKGRTREFFQWDVDLVGVDSPSADAEVITIAAELLKNLGLSPADVLINVNDRQLLETKLLALDIPAESMQPLFKAIDKKEKISAQDFEKLLKDVGLSDKQVAELDKLLNSDFSDESEWLTKVFYSLNDLGVSEYVKFNPQIVRGLDYYTRTVFEARDIKGEFRTIIGGGRYDNLVEMMGGEKLPGVGFASSDVILEAVLTRYNKIPQVPANITQVLVTVFGPEFVSKSIELSSRLRTNNINTELWLDPENKLDKQLKYADSRGIPYVAIIGPEEVAAEEVTVKNLSTGEQKRVKQEEIANLLNSTSPSFFS